MTKLLIGILSLALLGSGVLVGVAGGLDSEPARSVSLPGNTTNDDTTTGRTTTGTTTVGATTTGVEDISGPCDEVEHRNDPRCTGAGADDRDDNSGPGSGGDDGDDDREDNSGSGSGPGGDDDRDDNDDDRSGSNSGSG